MPGGNAPCGGISVIVPTRGHPASVKRLLASLEVAARALPAQLEHEVLVVDDSVGTEARAVAAICAESGARLFRGPRRVGAKRNLGVANARYRLLMFIDSDCVATPDLLRLHVELHAAGRSPSGRPVGAVAGPTRVVGAETLRPWRVVAPSVVVNSPWSWPERYQEIHWAATSNLSMSRRAFELVDGFDEKTATVVGGEDVDLGVRLDRAGLATICHPGAVVFHATDGVTTVRQFQRKMFRYGRACVYNCRRQPENARWSANPVSLLLLAVTGSPLSRRGAALRRWAVAVALGWFLAETLGMSARSRSPLLEAAGTVSVDWCFHAGIAAEAARRGRPLLAFRRYDYFSPKRFIPYDAFAVQGGGEADQ